MAEGGEVEAPPSWSLLLSDSCFPLDSCAATHKKLAAMQEKLAAAGLAPTGDSSEPDAAAAAEATAALSIVSVFNDSTAIASIQSSISWRESA